MKLFFFKNSKLNDFSPSTLGETACCQGPCSDHPHAIIGPNGSVNFLYRVVPPFARHTQEKSELAEQNLKPLHVTNTPVPAGDSFRLPAPRLNTAMNLLPPSCHAVIICVCLCQRGAT